ncbi:hypothetical protein L3X38_031838 [Prunus dulcis]|uniref:Uncharacterized protein n=1 Tax=Prunus dulcis TaxID=3755 RepID=A0AAD4VE13_PRUDU|nr:hypothetical protein L3X38_031838 [Prunus dulcis]
MAASPVSLMPQSPTSLKAPSLLDLSLPGSSASPLPSPASVSSLPQYGTVQLDNEVDIDSADVLAARSYNLGSGLHVYDEVLDFLEDILATDDRGVVRPHAVIL